MVIFSFFRSCFKKAVYGDAAPEVAHTPLTRARDKHLQDGMRILGRTTLMDLVTRANLEEEIAKIDQTANALYFVKNDELASRTSSALKKVARLLCVVNHMTQQEPGYHAKFPRMRGFGLLVIKEGARPERPLFTNGFDVNMSHRPLGEIIGFDEPDHAPQERTIRKPPSL